VRWRHVHSGRRARSHHAHTTLTPRPHDAHTTLTPRSHHAHTTLTPRSQQTHTHAQNQAPQLYTRPQTPTMPHTPLTPNSRTVEQQDRGTAGPWTYGVSEVRPRRHNDTERNQLDRHLHAEHSQEHLVMVMAASRGGGGCARTRVWPAEGQNQQPHTHPPAHTHTQRDTSRALNYSYFLSRRASELRQAGAVGAARAKRNGETRPLEFTDTQPSPTAYPVCFTPQPSPCPPPV
jgi:hypothetical protein